MWSPPLWGIKSNNHTNRKSELLCLIYLALFFLKQSFFSSQNILKSNTKKSMMTKSMLTKDVGVLLVLLGAGLVSNIPPPHPPSPLWLLEKVFSSGLQSPWCFYLLLSPHGWYFSISMEGGAGVHGQHLNIFTLPFLSLSCSPLSPYPCHYPLIMSHPSLQSPDHPLCYLSISPVAAIAHSPLLFPPPSLPTPNLNSACSGPW